MNRVVSIIIEAKDRASRVLGGVSGSVRGLGAEIGSLAGAIRIALTGAVAQGLRMVFQLGAAVEETGSKFRTVFGEASRDAQAFLDDFATMAGLSNRESQDLLATSAAIAQGMGFATQQSFLLSRSVLRLSADLASMNNLGTEDVVRRINSALTGERESLKSLGIVVTEVEVLERAMLQTRKRSVKELTAQEKATASLALITEKAGVAVGDLDRTMNSAANTGRRVAARLRNVRDALAVELLPAFADLLEEADGAAGSMSGFGTVIVGVGKVLRGFVDFLRLSGTLLGGFGALVVTTVEAIGAVLRREISFDEALAMLQRQREANEALLWEIIDDAAEREKELERIRREGYGAEEQRLTARQRQIERELAAERERIERLTRILAEDPFLVGLEKKAQAARDRKNQEQVDRVAPGIGLLNGIRLPLNLNPSAAAQRPAGDGTTSLVSDVGHALAASFTDADERRAKLELGIASLVGTFQGFGDAVSAAFAAMVDGSVSAGAAFKGAMLGALSSVARGFGEFFLAKAIAAFGEGLTFNPKGFLASAKFTAAAAAMFALSGALAGAANNAGGGAGGAGTFAGRDDVAGNRGEAVLIVEGGLLDMSDPRQADALARALENLSGRRVTVRAG